MKPVPRTKIGFDLLQGFLFLGESSKLSDFVPSDFQQTFIFLSISLFPVLWIRIGFSAYPDLDPAFYLKADPDPGR
jgi:hypothetical protein